MVKVRVKHVGWFFQFMWCCLKDLCASPNECVEGAELWEENWSDYKVKVYFDLNPEALRMFEEITKLVKKKKENEEY